MEEYITTEQMRREEERAVANGVSIRTLMENAGRGVAREIEKHYGPINGKMIVFILGKGNNGGDGSVAARYLSEMGAIVRAILLAFPEEIRTNEARGNWNALSSTNAEMLIARDPPSLLRHENDIINADLVVAAILGTGIRGSIREPEAEAIRLVNRSHGIKVAVDIPSGLDPDTGKACEPVVKADMTITMHRAKMGLRGNPEITGKVVIVPIGID